MINSDKFTIAVNAQSYCGLWCIACLAVDRRPALIHEWPGGRTQANLADLVSRAQAHWSIAHDDREDP